MYSISKSSDKSVKLSRLTIDFVGLNFDKYWFGLFRPPDKSLYWKSVFFISYSKRCCGYSKEPFQQDGSFEHPKYMFKLIGKEINAILGAQTILIWTYGLLLFFAIFQDNCAGL